MGHRTERELFIDKVVDNGTELVLLNNRFNFFEEFAFLGNIGSKCWLLLIDNDLCIIETFYIDELVFRDFENMIKFLEIIEK